MARVFCAPRASACKGEHHGGINASGKADHSSFLPALEEEIPDTCYKCRWM